MLLQFLRERINHVSRRESRRYHGQGQRSRTQNQCELQNLIEIGNRFIDVAP